jgi:phage shock protein C
MTTTSTTLARSQSNKMIAGVCAGIAQRYGWSAGKVRLLFVLSCILPGPQFIAYLALWAFLPKRP